MFNMTHLLGHEAVNMTHLPIFFKSPAVSTQPFIISLLIIVMDVMEKDCFCSPLAWTRHSLLIYLYIKHEKRHEHQNHKTPLN